MNKSQLVENIHAKSGLTIEKSEQVVNAVFDSIKTTLNSGCRVEIRGFGAFSIKEYKSYSGRNPSTGEPVVVPAKRLPNWRTGLDLNQRINH
ncbi:MAG: HU family DNA-binding protein [Oligoflexales bacterium]